MTLVLLALAWLLGIATVALWAAQWWIAGTCALLVSPWVAHRYGRRGVLLAAAMAAFAMLGALRFEGWEHRKAPGLLAHVGQEISLQGTVDSEPQPGRTTAAYRVKVVSVRGTPTDGKVLIRVGEYEHHLPGERVRLRGELEQPPDLEEFDYRGYLARQGIVGTMLFPELEVLAPPPRYSWRTRLAEVRLALEDSLQRALPEPAASLGAGIAFGRDDTLPDELYDDFRTTGLAHIVAVSGSNVAMVTAVVFFVCVRFMRRQWAVAPAALTLLAYVAVAGLQMSVVRAGVMALVFLLGLMLGRQQSALAALGAAAIVMIAVHPAAALDLGFQLSLAATAGLIAFGPWIAFGMRNLLERARIGAYVPELAIQVAALSLSATIATLPIVWVNFGQVSVVGVFANILVEPLFFVTFWLTVLTALAGLAWEPAGWLLGLAAYYPLAFIAGLARALADLPGAAVTVPRASGGAALLAYVLLSGAGWPAYRFLVPSEPRPDPSPAVRTVHRSLLAGATGAVAVAILPVTLLPLSGPGDLRVDLLDVGQGDAILLTTPNGHQVLVDGGPSGIELVRELGAVLPHWDRHLDQVVLTHPQQDHLAGLVELSRRYEVTDLALGPADATSETYRLLRVEVPEPRRRVAGDQWHIDGVQFDVLWPPAHYTSRDLNDRSLVIRVTYGDVSLLLTGDIEAGPQQELIAEAVTRADVLKVPHHGSKTSQPTFFDAVAPGLALISVGADNRFGHPHEETLAALNGTPILRTDLDGRITLFIDGRRVRVATER